MTYIFSFLFPLLLCWLICQWLVEKAGRSVKGWLPTFLISTVSLLLVTVIKIGGMPLSRWLISLNANYSIPLTIYLIHKIIQKATGRDLLNKKARVTFWSLGSILGLLLYPMALGFGDFDPYTLGWEFSILFVLMLILTFLLIYFNNSFGIVLILTILAFNLQLLESSNFWDYLIDPFYFFIALGLCFKRLILLFRKKPT